MQTHNPQIQTLVPVVLLVFDGVTMLDVSGPMDVLHQAGRLGSGYDLHLVSPSGGTVRSSSGLAIADTSSAQRVPRPHTLIVAGGDRLADRGLPRDLVRTAGELATRATRVASVCTGAFVLAELGLLDGRRATTHWRHADQLAKRYPKVRVEPDSIHMHDGRFVTSAGITAGIDLALALVEADQGADVARTIARELVFFMRRPGGQAQFSALPVVPTHDDRLLEVMDVVLADPAGAHDLTSLARSAALSTRHLARLFRNEVGTTPARWVERVRLESAQRLLLEGYSVTQAAQRSGLGSDETLRRAFERHLGTTPTAYRRRFATTAPD